MGPQSLQVSHMGSCRDTNLVGSSGSLGVVYRCCSGDAGFPYQELRQEQNIPLGMDGPFLLSWKAQVLSSVFGGTMNIFSIWQETLSVLGRRISRQAVWIVKGSESHGEDL